MSHDAEYILPSGRTRTLRNVSFEELQALHNLADAGVIPTPEDGFLKPATDEELKALMWDVVTSPD